MSGPLAVRKVSLCSGRAQCTEQEPVLYTDSHTDSDALLGAWPAMSRWQISDGSLVKNYGSLLFMAEQAGAGLEEVLLSEFVQGITDAGEHSAPPGTLPSQSKYIFEDRFSESEEWLEGTEYDSLLRDVGSPLPLLELPRDGAGYQFACPLGAAETTQLSRRWTPKFKWFLVGGKGSGLGVHQDPHGSSAWNATICGSKRWCFFPPCTPREMVLWGPGEHEWASQPEYSAHEWFETVYPKLKDLQLRQAFGMIEGEQQAGEVMFIPQGWWHIVENLEPTVAFTENFVTTAGIGPGLVAMCLEGRVPQATQWFRDLPCSWRCMAGWGALRRICCHSRLADCGMFCSMCVQECLGCWLPIPINRC